MTLELRNAHSILAALQARPDDVQDVVLPRGRTTGVWGTIAELAEQEGVPTTVAEETPDGAPSSQRRRRGGRAAGPDGKQGREGAAHAVVEERQPEPLPDVLKRGEPGGGGDGVVQRGVWLALDSIQDPRNVGAIFRAAAFFGVRGLVMGEDRAASLTAVTYDTASGGLESVPFALETNLRRALAAAKEAGLWILGTSEGSGDAIAEVPRDRDWLVVVGNEERGLRRLTLEACDVVCAIPSGGGPRGGASPIPGRPGAPASMPGRAGAPTSLNVSVATGIVLAMLGRSGA